MLIPSLSTDDTSPLPSGALPEALPTINNTAEHTEALPQSDTEEVEDERADPQGSKSESDSEAGCDGVHSDYDHFDDIWDADDLDIFACSIQNDEDVDLGMD